MTFAGNLVAALIVAALAVGALLCLVMAGRCFIEAGRLVIEWNADRRTRKFARRVARSIIKELSLRDGDRGPS